MFYSLDTLIHRAHQFRYFYGLNGTDITGGEPTIYCDPSRKDLPHRDKDGVNHQLVYLVKHCHEIGLEPSVISHGGNYTPAFVAALETAGIDTFELSIHGLGVLDGKTLGYGNKRLVVLHGEKEFDGGFQRLIDGARCMTRPIRWNSTVVRQTLEELPGVAQFLVDHFPPVVYNMIYFMRYYQHSSNERDFDVPVREAAPWIAKAVRIVEAAGWECNVRYFPPCVAHDFGFARNCKQFYQTARDPWEWDQASSADRPLRIPAGHVRKGWATESEMWSERGRIVEKICDDYARKRHPYSPACQQCAARSICEGPDEPYLKRFGADELKPFSAETFGMVPGAMVLDPNAFERLEPSVPEEPVTA